MCECHCVNMCSLVSECSDSARQPFWREHTLHAGVLLNPGAPPSSMYSADVRWVRDISCTQAMDVSALRSPMEHLAIILQSESRQCQTTFFVQGLGSNVWGWGLALKCFLYYYVKPDSLPQQGSPLLIRYPFSLHIWKGLWQHFKQISMIKPRRGFGRNIALQEIEDAVCLSIRLSVRPSVRLLPKGSQTTEAVTLNLYFYESPWPGPGYRPKKIENIFNPNFWRIFTVLNLPYCCRMDHRRRRLSFINIQQIKRPSERC